MSPRIRAAMIWAGAAIVVFGIAVALGTWAGSRRVEGSSSYCASCHAPESGDAFNPGHEDVLCQDCHAWPEEERFAMVWAIVAGAEGMPDHGETIVESCERCHRDEEAGWAALMHTEGHRTHSTDESELDCVSCHTRSLHAVEDAEDGCLSCHGDVALTSEPSDENSCALCHTFSLSDQDQEGLAPVEGDPTWGDEIGIEHAHGAADCRLCHNPHAPAPVEAEERTVVCTNCHRGAVAAAAANAPTEHQRCQGCHADIHASRDQVAIRCTNCHERPNLRLEQEVVVHGPGEWGTGVGADGPEVDESTLTHEGRCPSCHLPHGWRAERSGCAECHEENRDLIAALPEGTHTECMGCHEPHSVPPTRDDCARCHEGQARSGSGVPRDHRNCLSCHDPHRGKPRGGSACRECHGEPTRLVRSGPPRHRNCTSCHNPHRDPDANAATSCRQCHAPQAAAARGPAQHQRCNSCHTQHQFTKAAAMTRCASCHTGPTTAGVAHGGRCTDCHALHGNGRERSGNCATCHTEIRPTVARHNRCQGCHQPHTRSENARGQCRTCHAPQVASGRGWPSGSPHAGRCNECHEAHNEGSPPVCNSCHREQNNRAHTGPHPNCKGCHAPHQSPPAGGDRWWGRCGDCHRNQARAAAGGTATHRRCGECHDRPGRAGPECTTCHSDVRGLLLHSHEEHRQCTSCHTTHGNSPPTRARCMSCHREQSSHYPDAPRCQACHPFSQ